MTDVTATNALTLFVPPKLFDTPNTPGIAKKPKSGFIESVNFFGTKSVGTRFVYLLDKSGSMWAKAKIISDIKFLPWFALELQELERSLRMLKPYMKFAVVVYDNRPHYSMFTHQGQPRLITASKQNIDTTVLWLKGMNPGGGNLVVPAFAVAAKFRPDMVFLLSDGMVDLNPHEVCADILKLNSSVRARVNTISLHEPAGTNLMKRIAHQNTGEFRYIAPKVVPKKHCLTVPL